MTVKLVGERGTGRVLGAQIVGGERSAKRIDTAATALHARMRVDELDRPRPCLRAAVREHVGPDPHRRAAAWSTRCRTGRLRHGSGARADGPRGRPHAGRASAVPCLQRPRRRLARRARHPGRGRVRGGRGRPRGRRGIRPSGAEPPVGHRRPPPPHRPSGHGHPRGSHLVPDLGRGAEARPRRPNRPRGAGAGRRRPRHGHLLLQVRHLAGDPDLTDDLARRSLDQWQKRSKRWLEELSRRVASRHESAGEVAFLLEPDLKEGRGGLRDVHALHWAEAARRLLWEGDDPVLEDAYDALLSARVELHRRTGRPGDRLLLEEQDAVAAALHDESADALMHRLAAAARTIAWRSDDAWQRIDASLSGPLGWRSRRDKADRRRPRPPRRRGAPHRRRRPGRRPQPRAARRRRGRRRATRASTARRSTGSPPARGRSPSRGPRRSAPRSSICCWRGTARSRSSRPSTRWACGSWCSPSGRPCAASRSATPTTASRSTVTSWRPAPTLPPWWRAPTGPTSSCSARCCTTSARAIPATTPKWGSSC